MSDPEAIEPPPGILGELERDRVISPELAARVLDVDLRNIVKKVSEGGVLSPSERTMLQNFAFPEGAEKSRRAATLFAKYAGGGRLTAAELAELRDFAPEVPEFAPGLAPSAPPAPPEPLNLTPEPSPASGDSRITRAQLDRWAAMYGTAHRQLRRWIERGRQRGAPCPLDDPASMPVWIEKHIDKVRGEMMDRVQAAAAAARPAASLILAMPPAIVSGGAGVLPPPPESPAAESSPGVKPLDLAHVGGAEGEAVELFRRLFAATKLQLEEAYRDGAEERIRTLHTRLERVGEALRKHEGAAEAKLRRRGELLEKAEVIQEVSAAISIFRQMHEQMAEFILAELPELDPATAESLRSTIERVRDRELSSLRNLPSCRPDALAA